VPSGSGSFMSTVIRSVLLALLKAASQPRRLFLPPDDGPRPILPIFVSRLEPRFFSAFFRIVSEIALYDIAFQVSYNLLRTGPESGWRLSNSLTDPRGDDLRVLKYCFAAAPQTQPYSLSETNSSVPANILTPKALASPSTRILSGNSTANVKGLDLGSPRSGAWIVRVPLE
jgi:hypothetical protein